jgi:hypothetical protein
VNFGEKFSHPYLDSSNAAQSGPNESDLFKEDRKYFDQVVYKYKHTFSNSSSEEEKEGVLLCGTCSTRLQDERETLALIANIYKTFQFDIFTLKTENSSEIRQEKSLIKYDSGKSCSIKSMLSMNEEFFDTFTATFVQQDYSMCTVNLSLDM